MGIRTPTLLIIEDARDEAILVEHAARRCHPGIQVRVCADGFEGCAYLAGVPPFDDRHRHPRPDLVILDLYMPEIDGFAVLNWMRRRIELADIPVAVLTSSSRPEDESRARWLGARSVHLKPASIDDLGLTVREIVEEYIPRRAMLDALFDRVG